MALAAVFFLWYLLPVEVLIMEHDGMGHCHTVEEMRQGHDDTSGFQTLKGCNHNSGTWQHRTVISSIRHKQVYDRLFYSSNREEPFSALCCSQWVVFYYSFLLYERHLDATFPMHGILKCCILSFWYRVFTNIST